MFNDCIRLPLSKYEPSQLHSLTLKEISRSEFADPNECSAKDPCGPQSAGAAMVPDIRGFGTRGTESPSSVMCPSPGSSVSGSVYEVPQTPSPSEATTDVNPTLGRFVKVLDALSPSVGSLLSVTANHAHIPLLNNAELLAR